MPIWDKQAYESEASGIARAYLAGRGQQGSDIAALATKVARDHSLNAEQIRRLVRAANIAAFDQEQTSLKEAKAPDRIVEFDPGDAEKVIAELHAEGAPSGVKTAEATYPDLVDEVHPRPAQEKVASVEENLATMEHHLGREVPLDRQLMRLERVGRELDVRVKTAEHAWSDAMRPLDAAQRGLYFARDPFEKNALALHGGHVLPELNQLRAERRLPPLQISEAKLAELDDRLLGVEDAPSRLLKKAADAREEVLRLREGRLVLDAKVETLRRELFHV